jgi:AhpD family alkylhydroperoxidase
MSAQLAQRSFDMTRLNPWTAAPEQMPRMVDFAVAAGKGLLEPSLQHLVKIRASQINGCAVCLHVHASEARKEGETEPRVYMLDAWHEAPTYTDRERAALAWTEALTRLAETRAPDEAYEAVTARLNDAEVVALTDQPVRRCAKSHAEAVEGVAGLHHP